MMGITWRTKEMNRRCSGWDRSPKRPWKKTFGRVPLLHQTFWIINEGQKRVLGRILSGFSARKTSQMPRRSLKVMQIFLTFMNHRLWTLPLIYTFAPDGRDWKDVHQAIVQCLSWWPGASNPARRCCRKHSLRSWPHSRMSAFIDRWLSLQTCQGSKNSSWWSISIIVQSIWVHSWISKWSLWEMVSFQEC